MRSRRRTTNFGLALVGAVCFALLVGTAAAAPDRQEARPHAGRLPITATPGSPARVGRTAKVPPSVLRYKLHRRVHVRIDPHTILVRFAHGAAGTRSVRALGD